MKEILKKNRFLVIMFSLLLVLIIGGVYAVVVWTTTNYGVTLSTSCFDVNYRLGKTINAVLTPTDVNAVLSVSSGNSGGSSGGSVTTRSGAAIIPDPVPFTPNAITINSDMDVSSISLAFREECNRYSGIATIELNVTNISTAFTEEGNSTGSLMYFLLPYDSSEYPNVDVQHLDGETFNFVTSGSITETGTQEIFMTNLNPGETKEYIIVFLVDINQIDEDILGASFTGTVDSSVEQKVSGAATPVTDFTYVLGTGNSISTIPIYACSECINGGGGGSVIKGASNSCTKESYNYQLAEPITLSNNQILLTGYMGDDTEVNIPDSYTINGVTYDVVVLSSLATSFNSGGSGDNEAVAYNPYNYDNVEVSSLSYSINNGDINSTLLAGTSSVNYCSMAGTFAANDTIESVSFGDSVQFVSIDEYGDVYENSASGLFNYNTSLTTVSSIPSGVTNMSGAFYGCSSLTGDIRINSCDVESFSCTFDNTSNTINLLVPDHSTTANTAYYTLAYSGGSEEESPIKGSGGSSTKGTKSASFQSNNSFSNVYSGILPYYDTSKAVVEEMATTASTVYNNVYITTYDNDVCVYNSGGGSGSGDMEK